MRIKRDGFTLIELIIAVTILAILGTMAVTKYINMQEEAKKTAEESIVGAIREGISIYHMGQVVK